MASIYDYMNEQLLLMSVDDTNFTTLLRMMDDEQLEEFYKAIKKAGSFLKEHPAQDAVETVLVERRMYLRNDNGTITKNHAYKWFKK